jgi:hypothetical protein
MPMLLIAPGLFGVLAVVSGNAVIQLSERRRVGSTLAFTKCGTKRVARRDHGAASARGRHRETQAPRNATLPARGTAPTLKQRCSPVATPAWRSTAPTTHRVSARPRPTGASISPTLSTPPWPRRCSRGRSSRSVDPHPRPELLGLAAPPGAQTNIAGVVSPVLGARPPDRCAPCGRQRPRAVARTSIRVVRPVTGVVLPVLAAMSAISGSAAGTPASATLDRARCHDPRAWLSIRRRRNHRVEWLVPGAEPFASEVRRGLHLGESGPRDQPAQLFIAFSPRPRAEVVAGCETERETGAKSHLLS